MKDFSRLKLGKYFLFSCVILFYLFVLWDWFGLRADKRRGEGGDWHKYKSGCEIFLTSLVQSEHTQSQILTDTITLNTNIQTYMSPKQT